MTFHPTPWIIPNAVARLAGLGAFAALASVLAPTAVAAPPGVSAGAAPHPFRGAVVAFRLSFGDDTSDFAADGECDDPRFVGVASPSSGMAIMTPRRTAAGTPRTVAPSSRPG